MFDPELPWGCWLRREDRSSNEAPVYVDPRSGTEWRSVREAFSVGRLGQSSGMLSSDFELMHSVLAAVARRHPERREFAADFFGGNKVFADWYLRWLTNMELVGKTGSLTAEGMSVILMLTATRPQSVSYMRPSAATARQLSDLGLVNEGREDRFNRIEEAALGWKAAFGRRQIGGRPAIMLSKVGEGDMPTMRTIWTLCFDDACQRDDFFDWLCHRLDRWPEWAALATHHSSSELTHHLLGVVAGSVGDRALN